ncbi:MAG: DUF3617 family protein [Acidobacteriaceae bacterium]|jgi:hypothetical protein
MNLAGLPFLRLGHAGSIVLIVLSTLTVQAQVTTPIKQGLWQTQVTSSMQMALPPDVQAKIAAMPASQQAQMQAMMGGGGMMPKPTSSTVKSCVASTMTPSDLLNQAQQKSGMKCTFTNQQVTANSVSFDTSCTTTQGTATGHSQFTMTDSDHGTGTTHMTMAMSANGHSTTATMDGTSTYTYLGADCGDVKPGAPVVSTGQ